ncbi:MAG: hypothetical protein J6Q49_04800, partial [Kiritimatiellae bacterium]|nr:hypothetical protein [Kiritimatiellia bacterium]
MKTRNIFTKAAVVAALMLAPVAARAGFTSIYTLGSGDAGRELANNTVYKVESDLTLTNTGTGPGLSVASGATAVLYIKKGATLTVNGGNSNGTSAGDAGIRVLFGRTLVVTGGGKLVATGGNAANGADGGSWRCNADWGGSADAGSSHVDSTGGGNGGNGGAGASAAIGGYGGSGGSGGAGGNGFRVKTKSDSDVVSWDGNGGSSGSNGSDGQTMGTLYVLGNLTLTANGGSAGSGGGGGSSDGG